jgi:hypothetical protein
MQFDLFDTEPETVSWWQQFGLWFAGLGEHPDA